MALAGRALERGGPRERLRAQTPLVINTIIIIIIIIIIVIIVDGD